MKCLRIGAPLKTTQQSLQVREIQTLFVAQENTVQRRQRRYTMQSSITDVCFVSCSMH